MSTFNLSAAATAGSSTLTSSAHSETAHSETAHSGTAHSDTASAKTARPLTRYATPLARGLLGALWLFFGLNGFFNFLPPPSTPIPPGAAAFGGALMGTGYMFQLIASTEVVVGLALLANRWVPLALTLLAPLLVNILAFHVFLAPSGLAIPAVLLAIQLFLAWRYRDAYRPLLQPRSAPAAT